MDVLGWLLIPLAGLLVGLAWMVWRGREPKPLHPEQGMEELARFRQAMEKPLPSLRRSPTVDDPDAPTVDGPLR